MATLTLADVMKAGRGEGSRGGRIIGHTKSGKPIYITLRYGRSNWIAEHNGRRVLALGGDGTTAHEPPFTSNWADIESAHRSFAHGAAYAVSTDQSDGHGGSYDILSIGETIPAFVISRPAI